MFYNYVEVVLQREREDAKRTKMLETTEIEAVSDESEFFEDSPDELHL